MLEKIRLLLRLMRLTTEDDITSVGGEVKIRSESYLIRNSQDFNLALDEACVIHYYAPSAKKKSV